MTTAKPNDRWQAGDAYEAYMGRWSRRLAPVFLDWLKAARGRHWLEVGCGTGALTSAICAAYEPASVVAVDPSGPFIEHARGQLHNARVTFVNVGADALPERADGFDLAVSGLVLNFLADPRSALTAVRERLHAGGTFGAYVWDYADGMELLRVFWEEATALDSQGAAAGDERRRFSVSGRESLAAAADAAGFARVETASLVIDTHFPTFQDYWAPFTQGTGPAPSYVAAMDAGRREQLRERLVQRLAPRGGAVPMRARAWAVRGIRGD